MLRWILLLAVVNGLLPGVHETVELVTHYVQTGHVAHFTEGERDLPTDSEHQCSPLAHHCGCCVSMHVTPAVGATPSLLPRPRYLPVPPSTERPRDALRRRLLRPPVLS